ncbi:MAG: hypothetical protein ACOC42_02320 [Halobacteriota archaeon]
MSAYESVVETDRSFLWRSGIISILWLLLFAIASVLLILFQESVGSLFF